MRRFIGFITSVVLAAAMSGCSAPSTEAIIGLTFIPNIQFAPFYNADSAGWYVDDSGISLRHHGSSEGLFTALSTGEEDFVVAGGDEILQARSEGIDVVAVASYYQRYPAQIIVPADSPIATVADLAGRSVGIPGKFGESWFVLLVALAQAGLSESDVTIAEIGYTQQASLSSGQVDAVVGFTNSDLLLIEASGMDVRAIDPDVSLVSICLATTSAYAEENPGTVTSVIAAMTRGIETAMDDPETTYSNAEQYIPSFRDEVRAQAELVLPATTALFADSTGGFSPTLDPKQWEDMRQAMSGVGLIPESTDASDAYTNNYLP